MHSTIFGLELVDALQPQELDVFNEDTLEFEDVSSFADYIANFEDDQVIDNEMNYFVNFLKCETVKIDGKHIIKLTKEVVGNYLEKKLDALKECVETLDLKKFANDPYELIECVNDNFGYHIYNDHCLYTLDEFMKVAYRFYLREREVVYFQITGCIDYHY